MLKKSVTRRGASLSLLVLQLLASSASGELAEVLKPAGPIALGRIEGHICSIAADADGGRLYVAENVYPPAIVLIDAKSGKEVGRGSKGLTAPEGMAFVPDSDHLVVSNHGGRISLYDGNLTLAGVVENEVEARCVRYDPVLKLAYVGHGNGHNWIAVIDPRKIQKVGDIQLDGYPMGFQLETKGDRMFVNIPRTQQIAVIDRQKRAVVGIWPVAGPAVEFP